MPLTSRKLCGSVCTSWKRRDVAYTLLSSAFRPLCVLSSQGDVRCLHSVLPGRFRVWVTVWVRPYGGSKMTTL